jgi:hypothetical protein
MGMWMHVKPPACCYSEHYNALMTASRGSARVHLGSSAESAQTSSTEGTQPSRRSMRCATALFTASSSTYSTGRPASLCTDDPSRPAAPPPPDDEAMESLLAAACVPPLDSKLRSSRAHALVEVCMRRVDTVDERDRFPCAQASPWSTSEGVIGDGDQGCTESSVAEVGVHGRAPGSGTTLKLAGCCCMHALQRREYKPHIGAPVRELWISTRRTQQESMHGIIRRYY